MLVAVAAVSVLALSQGRVAIVLDVGGRGDLSFNDMGFRGADRATEELGWDMVEVQSASASDYLPNLRNLARTGEYDLIIPIGFLLGDALAAVAQEFPDQRFATIDVDYITGPNIANYVFRENEVAALIGCLAAMCAAAFGCDYTGVVLGVPIPVLFHFEAGYRFGQDWGLDHYAEFCEGAAARARATYVGMLYNYTGTFGDIALGKAASESMLAQGAVGICSVAAGLASGIHDAVSNTHVDAGTTYGPPFYYGADANQDWLGLGMHTLASAIKRVDIAVYEAIRSVVNGTFTAGITTLGLAEGGVAISDRSTLDEFIDFAISGGAVQESDRDTIIANWTANRATVPDCIWDAVAALEAGILDGSIVVPTADTDDEIQDIRDRYPLE